MSRPTRHVELLEDLVEAQRLPQGRRRGQAQAEDDAQARDEDAAGPRNRHPIDLIWGGTAIRSAPSFSRPVPPSPAEAPAAASCGAQHLRGCSCGVAGHRLGGSALEKVCMPPEWPPRRAATYLCRTGT